MIEKRFKAVENSFRAVEKYGGFTAGRAKNMVVSRREGPNMVVSRREGIA